MLEAVLLLSILNIILILLLVNVKKRIKEEEKRRKKLEKLAEQLLEKQILQLTFGDDRHTSVEVEIAKYIKDYLLNALVRGNYNRNGKKYVDGRVLKQYPELFEFFDG